MGQASAPARGPDAEHELLTPRRFLALALGAGVGLLLATLLDDLRSGLVFASVWFVSRFAFALYEHAKARHRQEFLIRPERPALVDRRGTSDRRGRDGVG